MGTRRAKNYIERGAIVTTTIIGNALNRGGTSMIGIVIKVRSKQPRRKTRTEKKPDPYTVAEVQEYGSGVMWTVPAKQLKRIGTADDEQIKDAAQEAEDIKRSHKENRARRKEYGITTNKAYRRLTGLEGTRVGTVVYMQFKTKNGETYREPGLLAGYSTNTGEAYVHIGEDARQVSARKIEGGTRYKTSCRFVTPHEDTPTPIQLDLEEAKIILDTEPSNNDRVML